MEKISKALEQRIADRKAKKIPKAVKGLPDNIEPSSRIVHLPTSENISHGGKIKY